ncbi:hypothetical protein, partial [Caedibacter taeniospiralis]|uniref:hypothetical protein n=1 Tax=Caedibacter taeniospiralis TaxID=28907 RepID=UPI0037BFC7F6
QHSSDSTLRLGLKLFHRLRSGAFGTPLADQQRKATRVLLALAFRSPWLAANENFMGIYVPLILLFC